mgnify:CR=1 FL=1
MKKRLCIISVFLSLFLLFSNFSVKANEIVFPAFPEPVEGQSSTHYIIFYDIEDNRYKLYKPLEIDNHYVYRDGPYTCIRYPSSVIYYEWKEGMGSWKYINTYNALIDTVFDDEQILYSSFDLKYENGDIFFPKAPIKANFLAQLRKVKMGATMTTVVSLIPLLVLLIVSLIGFRKAWAWLSKVLRKA